MGSPMYKNRMANIHNRYQNYDQHKRVLCVCSAGLLRSPTAAFVLSQEPFGFNTRACGVSEEFALIVVDQALIEWADEIVCFSDNQRNILQKMVEQSTVNMKKIIMLDIPDNYGYRDEALMELIRKNYTEAN